MHSVIHKPLMLLRKERWHDQNLQDRGIELVKVAYKTYLQSEACSDDVFLLHHLCWKLDQKIPVLEAEAQ